MVSDKSIKNIAARWLFDNNVDMMVRTGEALRNLALAVSSEMELDTFPKRYLAPIVVPITRFMGDAKRAYYQISAKRPVRKKDKMGCASNRRMRRNIKAPSKRGATPSKAAIATAKRPVRHKKSAISFRTPIDGILIYASIEKRPLPGDMNDALQKVDLVISGADRILRGAKSSSSPMDRLEYGSEIFVREQGPASIAPKRPRLMGLSAEDREVLARARDGLRERIPVPPVGKRAAKREVPVDMPEVISMKQRLRIAGEEIEAHERRLLGLEIGLHERGPLFIDIERAPVPPELLGPMLRW